MIIKQEVTEELKIYLEFADPILMNNVLMFALTKLHPQLNEEEINQLSLCHKLLSAMSKQKIQV